MYLSSIIERLEMARVNEVLSSKLDENNKLSAQVNTLQHNLQETGPILDHLLQLDSVQHEVDKVKQQLGKAQEQHEATMGEMKLSQLKVSTLEDHLRHSQRMNEVSQMECVDLRKEREKLLDQVVTMREDVERLKQHHSHQVHS